MLLGIKAASSTHHDHHHITEELDSALNWFSTFYQNIKPKTNNQNWELMGYNQVIIADFYTIIDHEFYFFKWEETWFLRLVIK